MIAQRQSQRQTLKILPQQIQLLNFFFLNSLELEQRIKNELEENPFLDTIDKADDEDPKNLSKDEMQDYQDWEEVMYDDKPNYKQEYQNFFDAEATPERALVNVQTFKEEAHNQVLLMNISAEEQQYADYIIDILNNDGFMDRPLEEVADDMSFHFQKVIEQNTVQLALSIVQTLEPIGIGSCNIQECLLIQLRAMDMDKWDVKLAIELLETRYNDLMHRQFEKIHHTFKIDDDQLKDILHLISGLKFHPITETSAYDPKNTIIPDFIVSNYGGDIRVNLYSSRADCVFVNQLLHDELAGHVSSKDKTASQYIKSKLNAAEWFVSAVKQRETTMINIMNCIVKMQKEYFIDGDIRLIKPMVLRNVAEVTGLDISTISRITSNKYAETHFGIIYLKDLFSEGITDKKGEVISNKVIRSVIEEAIQSENKKQPFTDQQLVNILSSDGYNIARRTIAKYREQMQIPIAQIRAVWS